MIRNRLYVLQYLILAGIPIPLGGESDSARIAPGPPGTLTRARKTTIYNADENPDTQLTIMLYPEDATRLALKPIIDAQRAGQLLGIMPPLPGSAGNLATGEGVVWTDAKILNLPDIVLGREATVVELVLGLHGVSYV